MTNNTENEENICSPDYEPLNSSIKYSLDMSHMFIKYMSENDCKAAFEALDQIGRLLDSQKNAAISNLAGYMVMNVMLSRVKEDTQRFVDKSKDKKTKTKS